MVLPFRKLRHCSRVVSEFISLLPIESYAITKVVRGHGFESRASLVAKSWGEEVCEVLKLQLSLLRKLATSLESWTLDTLEV